MQAIRDVFVDRLGVLGQGIERDGYLTDPDPLEAEVKRAMIERARNVVLVATGQKFDERGLHVIAHAERLQVAFLSDPPADGVDVLRVAGVQGSPTLIDPPTVRCQPGCSPGTPDARPPARAGRRASRSGSTGGPPSLATTAAASWRAAPARSGWTLSSRCAVWLTRFDGATATHDAAIWFRRPRPRLTRAATSVPSRSNERLTLE